MVVNVSNIDVLQSFHFNVTWQISASYITSSNIGSNNVIKRTWWFLLLAILHWHLWCGSCMVCTSDYSLYMIPWDVDTTNTSNPFILCCYIGPSFCIIVLSFFNIVTILQHRWRTQMPCIYSSIFHFLLMDPLFILNVFGDLWSTGFFNLYLDWYITWSSDKMQVIVQTILI